MSSIGGAVGLTGVGGAGRGFGAKTVFIRSIDIAQDLVLATDANGVQIELSYRTCRTGRYPLVGDTWIADRSLGPWTLAAYVGLPDHTRFATFQDLNNAFAVSSPQFGATYWVDEYGGNAQWQTTGTFDAHGLPIGGWQWLPNGYQNSNFNYVPAATSTGTNAGLITSVALRNPSQNRVYKVTASANVFGSVANMQISLGLLWDTSPMAATVDVNRDWLQENVVTNPGLADYHPDFIHLSNVCGFFPSGNLWFGAYIINRTGGSTVATTSSFGWWNICVEDIGATS